MKDGGRGDISVVMPAYNRAYYLPFSVQTVLEQTVPVREILIIDDGSTDETPQVVAGLKGPIRYLRQENRGPAAARNVGIQAAEGALVALLDSDDCWRKDRLEKELEVLEGPQKPGLVHSGARIIDAAGCPTGAFWGRPEYQGEVFARLLIQNGVNASSVLVKRELLTQAGGYDERFPALENWDLWLRLARHCTFGYVPEPLIEYRVHGGNLIGNMEKLERAWRLLLEKHGDSSIPAALRRRAWARFHEAFGHAWVARGQWAQAQAAFLASLKLRPWQPGLYWRLLRVGMVQARGRLSRLPPGAAPQP